MYFATHFFEAQILNTLRNITAVGYSSLFVGLFVTNPTNTGAAGIEISYANYERQPIQFTPPAPEGSSIGIRNSNAIVFPTSAQDAGTVTHLGIFDSSIGGNMLLFGDLTIPLQIQTNSNPSILQGDILYFSQGDFTNAFKTSYLNVLRNINLAGFISHLALFNNDPQMGGVELFGENYSRPSIPFSSPTVNVSGASVVSNSSSVIFPTPMNTWGNWTHSCIMTQAAGGEVAMTVQRIPETMIHRNYVPQFPESGISIALD